MRGNFIGGDWKRVSRPEGTLVRHNPAQRSELLFEIPWDTTSVDVAVKAAKQAVGRWDKLGRDGRLPYLERFAKALTHKKKALALAISEQAGKPLWEAEGEANALVAKIRIMTGPGAALTAPVDPPDVAGGCWSYRPLGVVAVLGPFNFPLHLPNGHIVPALFAGNTVVVKPSEMTSACMELYFECAEEAGFPPGVLNLVHGPGQVGAALVEHADISAVLFTGSYETGLRIKRATLEHHWKLLALEMGGKNTSIVLEDADIEQAVNEIAFAAYMTAGQRCSATSRVVVRSEVIDSFIERFVEVSKRVSIGDPIKETPFMGPLANRAAYEKYMAAQAEDEDGNLVCLLEGGAAREDLDGYYVKPAIWRVTNLNAQGAHQSQEIFGPDVVIYEANCDPVATKIANATDFGLAMSIFTRDEARFDLLSLDLQAGIVNMNRSTCGASSGLPFGGIKKSGNHRPSAILAGRYCTYPQAQLRVEPGWPAEKSDTKPWSLLDEPN